MSATASDPSPGRVLRTLNDGFWDLTEVIELPDGSRRVRKRSKGATAERPWGLESLRREIRYLCSATPAAAEVLPRLLAWWDRPGAGGPEVGYEMPFYPDHRDAGALARGGTLAQAEVDEFQRELAGAVFVRLHATTGQDAEPLSRHMTGAVRQAFDGFEPFCHGDQFVALTVFATSLLPRNVVLFIPIGVAFRIGGRRHARSGNRLTHRFS